MKMAKYIFVYTTFPDEEKAREIGEHLVREKLAACVNFWPIKSIYTWKGEIQHDQEVAMIIKTKKELYEKVERRLKELYPYEVPAILEIEITRGLQEYLGWLKECTE